MPARSKMNTDVSSKGKAEPKPTPVQLRWLARGLTQAGGKLPLFEKDGREISRATVNACIAAGWAEPWFTNPTKPDWIVCKLTANGRRIAGG